jgi:hypothetical protein
MRSSWCRRSRMRSRPCATRRGHRADAAAPRCRPQPLLRRERDRAIELLMSAKMNVMEEETDLRACHCCLKDYVPRHPALPYCSRWASWKCARCRFTVRVMLWQLDPQAINLSGRSRGPCGRGCGANLTNSQMRRHFTDCPRLPSVQQTNSKQPAKPNRGGRPPGPRMLCGWRCGAKLTATVMRKHFAQCSRRLRFRREECSCRGGPA